MTLTKLLTFGVCLSLGLNADAQEGLYPPNFSASDELFVQIPTTNVTICYQTIGRRTDPALLLIGGLGSSMMAFNPQLLSLLSPPQDPHYLIRFDLRDTGRSTAFPINEEGKPPQYLLQDMVNDIIGLIDHIGIPVHLAGFSMGGPLGFLTAAQRPDMVKSMFLMLTSPVGPVSNPDDNLPPIRPNGTELLAGIHAPLLDDSKEDWMKFLVESQLVFYTQPPWDVEVTQHREIAAVIYDRGITNGTLVSNANHGGAAMWEGRWPREAARDVKCPALVVSAELDQFYDPAHGRALAGDMAGGHFKLYEDSGHEVPRRIWGKVTGDMLETMARGDEWWMNRGDDSAQGPSGSSIVEERRQTIGL